MSILTPNEQGTAWIKVAVAWVGAAVGGLTPSTIVLTLTGIFTVLQIYKFFRDLRKEIRMEKLEAKLKHGDTS